MNKEDERYFLDEFLNLQPGLNPTNIVGMEEPDFICSVAGQQTGIEVTRFFYPSSAGRPPQAVERYRADFGKRMRTEHCNTDIPPVHVSVHTYRDDALIEARGRTRLEKELFAFVRGHVPPIGPYVRYDYDSFPAVLHELGIDSVSLIRDPRIKKPFWSFPYGTSVPESSANLIQDVITKKNLLLPVYRAKAPKQWLLILSGADGLHSLVDLDGDILTATYSGGFDRVFLFRTFGPSVHELKLASQN